MASETVSSDHPSIPDAVEKKVCEEVKSREEEGISPSKESEDKPKDKDVPSPEVTKVELVEKIEENQSESAAIEEVTKVNEDEEPKGEHTPALKEVTEAVLEEKPESSDSLKVTVSSAEPEENVDDKHADALEVQKPDDAPAADASAKESPDPEKEETRTVAEHVAVNCESKAEDQIEEAVNEEAVKETEEQPKKIDVPESSVEAVGKEGLSDKEPAAPVVEDAKTSEEQHEKEEISPQVTAEEEQPVAQPAIAGETDKDSAAAKPKEVEDAVSDDTRSLTDKNEESKLIKEEEASPTEISDQVTLADEVTEAKAKAVDAAPAEAGETTHAETKEKEAIDIVEEPMQENEATKVKTEESAQPETTAKIGDDKSEGSQPGKIEESKDEKGEKTELTKVPTTEVSEVSSLTETATKGEYTSRDIEMDSGNGGRKDETVAPVESKTEIDVQKAGEVAPTTATTKLGDLLKPNTEAKGAENVEAADDSKDNEADQSEKSDVPSVESTKDADEQETTKDNTKEEVPGKTKQSNNILTKMKQSLVKARKAIIGKSTNSKAPSSEVKTEG